MRRLPCASVLAALLLQLPSPAQQDPDRDGDGLSDFQETHKYLTDPRHADSDRDGIPDGDWRERREYQYTVRTVVHVMKPVTIDYLCDDHQDARILDETDDYVELEVIHYPFTTVAQTIGADAKWRRPDKALRRWLEPGPTSDWTPAMQKQLLAELKKDGIDPKKMTDKELVEQAAKWLCRRANNQDCFTTFVTAFDDDGRPFIPKELREHLDQTDAELQQQWSQDVSARGMFEQKVRGSCSSSAIYLNGCLRALGIPTRTILTIPLVDGNDERELQLVERGITHHQLRERILPSLRRLKGSWASHTFNEVFVDGRWRRLNYHKLGQDIVDENLFGMITHVATFHDWADADMPRTIGRRQTLRHNNDVFGFANPYSTIAVRDQFGPHCKIENAKPKPLMAKVLEVQWGDSEQAPQDIRSWFAQRKHIFGLVAKVQGPRGNREMNRFLAAADLRVYLQARGKPSLGIGFDAGHYWPDDGAWWVLVPFGKADRDGHAADASYRFVCRNDKDWKWAVADSVFVPKRE